MQFKPWQSILDPGKPGFFSDTICAIWGGTVLIPSMCVKTAFAKKVFMLALNLIYMPRLTLM